MEINTNTILLSPHIVFSFLHCGLFVHLLILLLIPCYPPHRNLQYGDIGSQDGLVFRNEAYELL
jgi:hypothetical protein